MDPTSPTPDVRQDRLELPPPERWHAMRWIPEGDRYELMHPTSCQGRLAICPEAVALDEDEGGLDITVTHVFDDVIKHVTSSRPAKAVPK